MNKKELMHMVLVQYIVFYTCTMLSTILFCRFGTPPLTEVPVSYLWQIALFSVCAELPCAVYYSKQELTRRQWWFRTAIHTVLVEVCLMTAGYCIGMYRGVLGGTAFFVTVLLVDLLVRLITYLSDRNTAEEINAQLKQLRKGRSERDDG